MHGLNLIEQPLKPVAVFWTITAIVQFVILYFAFGLAPAFALGDTLASVGLFSLGAVGIGYMVRFAGFVGKSWFDTLLRLLLGALLMLALWLIGLSLVLHFAFGKHPSYIHFLYNSLPVRAIIGVFVYLLVVAFLFLVQNARELRLKAQKESAMAQALSDAEISLLRSQVKPHFLFNSLNSVSALITSHPEDARTMLLLLSDFMRYSFTTGAKPMIALGEEVDYLQKYLAIEKVRFGERLLYDISFPDDFREFEIPGMVLQPLVENSVKYGLGSLTGKVNIHIRATAADQNLDLCISNPFDPDGLPKPGAGTSLKNIGKRLEQVYSRQGLMEIGQMSNIFSVTIHFPISAALG